MISPIIQSRVTSILLGLVLIAYAIYDINEELFNPSHEHILILIGMLLVISSFGHVNEGVYKIASSILPNREFRTLEKIGGVFHNPVVRVILGLAVLIAAAYGLYNDYEKIHSKSVSMGIGVLVMLLPILKAFIGGENLMKGIKQQPIEDYETTE